MKVERADGAEQDNDEDLEDDVHEKYRRSARYKNGQDAGSVYAFGPSKLASLQHVDNLSAIIGEGIRQQQMSRVAVASSLLIPHLAMTGERKYRPSETQRTMRQLHAVEASLECVQHPPQAVTGQQLMRLLRQVQALQVTPGHRVALQLEQAFASMLEGNLSDAYDALAGVLTGGALDGDQFTAEAFCGLTRHAQWASAMQAAAAQPQAKPSPGHMKAEAVPCGDLDWFAHNPALVAAAGGSASEFWKDAERHLKAALAIQPATSELTYTLTQMYCALGKHAQALEAVSQLCLSAPHDADAHALHLLLLEAQGITSHEQACRAGKACCQLLKCDPGAHSAAQLLVRLDALRPVPPAALADALMLHLDVCSASSPTDRGRSQKGADAQEPGTTIEQDGPTERGELRATNQCAAATWAALAGLLTRCARQSLQAPQFAGGHTDGASPAPAEPPREPTAAEDSSHHTASSSSDWLKMQPVLCARGWWWGAHTLKPACIDALAGAGEHETLAAMALVAAFVDIRDASIFCRRGIAALEAAQEEQLCWQLQEGLELCQALQRQVGRQASDEAERVGRKRRRRDSVPPAEWRQPD